MHAAKNVDLGHNMQYLLPTTAKTVLGVTELLICKIIARILREFRT